MAKSRKNAVPKEAQAYAHPTAELASRPEIGTQAHFKKTKAPTVYRYDSSLAPELEWDGQNPARETAEALIVELAEAARRLAEVAGQPATTKRDAEIARLRATVAEAESRLRRLSGPFLNWAGKAERLSFAVPTLPLFVHERLSTRAILETLKEHQRDKQDDFMGALFGSPERSLSDQVLRAYEHRDQWVNRLILGDSLVAMTSLLRFESLGGQVQTIYMDPPYGVKFGSNFQPFVRKAFKTLDGKAVEDGAARDVTHNDDDDLTREPEMVQAYRDTWELGLHSYLTYLRDRLLLCRDLLAPSGSIFVQISDENLHHVRELMDEVFGAENCVAIIAFKKTGFASDDALSTTHDFLIWFAKERERMKLRPAFGDRELSPEELGFYDQIELPDGSRRAITKEERALGPGIRDLGRPFARNPMVSPGWQDSLGYEVEFEGQEFRPPPNRHWATMKEGVERLRAAHRLAIKGNTLRFLRYFDDFPFQPLGTVWNDTGVGGFVGDERLYVVQTDRRVIERCLLMTTDPGDLVLDPTCGSGTTAFVAEQWGRRWITMDTSRVPLALARQRLLTATFDYYELKDEGRGPAGGFVFKRKQNQKGEEVGGIVPHVTLKSIANAEPPAEEVLVDRPEVVKGIVRVTGPFAFEATIPTAEGLDEEPETPGIQSAAHQTHVERMLEVLRRAPVLRLPGNQTLTLRHIRPPAKTLTLSAEATVANGNGGKGALEVRDAEASVRSPKADADEPVAILFGPENGPLSERLVREAWDEAGLKHYARLFVIGFGIDPKAREFVEKAGQIGIPCVYLQATMDLQMGDLLKNMRSSQVFSVCGLPDVAVRREKKAKGAKKDAADRWQVELLGLDTFDPATMEPQHLKPADVPAWFLDTDYNGLVFRVCQAFFPRTGAWENLKRELKAEFEETVWEHLAGTVSAPFAGGGHGQVAVKVIDPRGNELIAVKELEG